MPEIQITCGHTTASLRKKIETTYGKITIEDWLEREAARIVEQGRDERPPRRAYVACGRVVDGRFHPTNHGRWAVFGNEPLEMKEPVGSRHFRASA